MALRRRNAKTIDLDRQLEFSEHRYFLAGVGDDHHALRRRRDDFFAQQRAAAALDQPQGRIEFVGPVHRQVEFGRFVERGQAQMPFFGLEAGAFRGGDADDIKPVAHLFADAIDKMGGRRAGAEAKPHAGANQGGGALGGLAFQQFDGRKVQGGAHVQSLFGVNAIPPRLQAAR